MTEKICPLVTDALWVFFVAPDGDDSRSGRTPKGSGVNGPLATVRRALDLAAQYRRRHALLKQPVVIRLCGGVYRLTEPLRLTPDDSGTPASPTVIEADENQKPVLSGGRVVTGWQIIELNGRKVWVTELPEVRAGRLYFRNFWVNDRRSTRARYPSYGDFDVVDTQAPAMTPMGGQDHFLFKPGQLKNWPSASQAEIVVMQSWCDMHLPVKQIVEETSTVVFTRPGVFGFVPQAPYYIENLLEALVEPGQWFLDRRDGRLYYLPWSGETPEAATAVMPVLEQVVRLEGQPERGRFIEHVILRGIGFAHTEWKAYDGSEEDIRKTNHMQAASNVPGAVWAEGARHCAFETCTATHIGNYAFELARGCQSNRIVKTVMRDLGAGGVKIGEQSIREGEAEQTIKNEVSDCVIANGGNFFHQAVGIWVGQSAANRLIHNEIHDLWYTGISVGWTWGYGPAAAGGNLIAHNHIFNIGIRRDTRWQPYLSDLGGIYTLGIQPGTVIRNNLIHDVAGRRYNGMGIYLDEGSQDIRVENNLVYNTTHGGFTINYGKDNIVRNNIFAFGRDIQVNLSARAEPHRHLIFENNIIYWSQGKVYEGGWGAMKPECVRMEGNIYWNTTGAPVWLGNMAWAEWQEAGFDRQGAVVDPGFIRTCAGDFRLRRGSPALKRGFKLFPLDDSGPRQ